MIAVGSFGLGIASIQSLGPKQRSRLGRHPLRIARAGNHALGRHMLGQRHAGHFVFQFAIAVPHFHFAGKFALRRQIRIRTMDPAHQNVLAIRRRLYASEDGWLAHGDDATASHIHQQQLGGGVVIKQVFVVGVGQQIFIGAHGSFLAVAFLDHRALGDLGLGRRMTAPRRNGFHQQGVAVRHPLESIAQNGADLSSRNLTDLGAP